MVELLTAIVLTALVSAMALPTAKALLDSYRLTSAANQLAFEISRARMQAVGQNMFVRLKLLKGGHYALEESADGTSYTRDRARLSLPPGVRASVGQTGIPGFDRQGLGTSSTTIVLSNPRGRKAVWTNILGRVTIS